MAPVHDPDKGAPNGAAGSPIAAAALWRSWSRGRGDGAVEPLEGGKGEGQGRQSGRGECGERAENGRREEQL
jgi:hypothetical protein